MHVTDTMAVCIVLHDQMSEDARNGKCGLRNRTDHVEFTRMLVHHVNCVSKAAWRGLGELVDIKLSTAPGEVAGAELDEGVCGAVIFPARQCAQGPRRERFKRMSGQVRVLHGIFSCDRSAQRASSEGWLRSW